MTLDPEVKEEIKRRWPEAFSYQPPPGDDDSGLLCVDMMKDFKGGTLPDYIRTTEQLVVYFIRKIFGYLDRGSHVVVCVDKDSPAVKAIVCHGKRKEWRCVRCKPLEKGVYHQECEKECSKKEPLSHKDGPHLPEDPNAPLPFLAQDWMRFATDSENLRRELYPRLVNALLCVTLPAGKYLYISGFPLKIKEVLEWAPNTVLHREKHVVIEPWSLAHDLPLRAPKEVFCHTMVIEGGVKRLSPAMFNEIQEADNAIFYYLSFFPEPYRQKVLINDGDAISIGLFLAQEYSMGPEARAHELFLMLPNHRQGTAPFEYVNLSLLHDAVGRTFEFEKGGVQNRVATLVFLIILSGTDFFQDFCYGIGTKTNWNENPEKREKQTKGVWDTFFDKADLFSHLVQFYRGAPSVRAERRIVLDERMFERFVQECFISKYGKTIVKKRKTQVGEEISFAQIRAHIKSKERQPPPDNVILRQCRQIDWHLNYWINAWRNVHVDPFERHMDLPYYGYEQPGKLVDVVASKQKPVDEVCKRNFLKRKLKQKDAPPVVLTESKKRLALAAIKGDF
jgi:hypothetical protein